MPKTYRSKLLAGAAPAAVLALVECASIQANAQMIPDPLKPVKYDVFLEGGRAFGSSKINEIAYAEPTPAGGVRAPGVPNTIDPGDTNIWRIGGAIHFQNGWSGNAAYTGLNAHNSAQAGPAAGQIFYSVLGGGNVGTPGAGTYSSFATARTSVGARLVDFQAGYDVGLGNLLGTGDVQSTLLLGARYGHVTQETDVFIFRANGVFQGQDHRRSSFHGIGPTVGATASLPLIGNLSLGGSFLGGVMFGQLSSDTVAAGNGFPLRARRVDTDRTAGTIDAQLALSYAVPLGGVTAVSITGGYQVNYLTRVRDTKNGASPLFGGQRFQSFGATDADLLFDGPFARLKFTF
jgi:hypothetical protein